MPSREHPMRRRALSECADGRSTLRGLAINLYPTEDSAFDLPSVSQAPSVCTTTTTDSDHSSSDVSRATSTSTRASTVYSTLSTVSFPTMRSSKGMQGLLDAELGGSMVEFDPYSQSGGGASVFKTGHQIGLTPNLPSTAPTRTRQRAATHSGASLARSGTLFSNDASASRKSAELKTLLGGSSHKLPSKATIPPPSSGKPNGQKRKPRRSASTNDISDVVTLEKAKSKARVEVDIELESETVVEGGYLRGKMEVTIRKPGKNESPIWIGGGKMRIVGFEGLPHNDTRYTFYQCTEVLSSITSVSHHLFASSPDEEGFCQAREGTHVLPFAMKIPISGTAKGALQTKSGAMVRYIAMGSIKIKDQGSSVKSIAHFYRNVEIYPFLGQAVLSPAEQPLRTSTAQTLFMGGSGKLQVVASLHRRIWIAGQRCYVHVTLNNETTKKVKTLTFTLVRTTTLFQPKAELDARSPVAEEDADIDACETSTNKKEVAQCTLEMGQKGERGCVTAKGFWTGVDPGGYVELSHFLQVPSDALSIARGRLIEVDYMLRISAGTGPLSSDVTVQLPIRIINFLSIDPPPTMPRGTPVISSTTHMASTATSTTAAAMPSPKKEAPQGRRRSVSMHNVREHEEQLRLWERSHGPAAGGSPLRSTGSQLQQPPQQRSMTPAGHRSTTPTSQRHQPQNPSHGLSASTSAMSSPTRSAMRVPTSAQSSPNRWPQPSYNYPGTATPFHQSSPTRSVGQTSPTRSILSSPERGRARAQEMFGGQAPTVSRSKTVAFADELRPHVAHNKSYSMVTAHSQSSPNGSSRKPVAPAPVVTRSESVPLSHPKLRHMAEPSPTFSPIGMKLTASAAADDEMESDSESSGYTDDDRGIYGAVDSALLSRTPIQTRLGDGDQSFEVDPDRVGSASPILGTALQGDMSRDGMWEEHEGDRSLDAEELTEQAAIRLGKEEYLLETSLPMIGGANGSRFTSSPSPIRPTDVTELGQSSPSKMRVPGDSNTARSMGRSQSAMVFSSSRYPSFHASAIVQPKPQTRIQPRPVTSFSVGDVIPRPGRERIPANRNGQPNGSMIIDGFPFPPVPAPTEEEARWSGVPTTAQITKVSRGVAVMTPLPVQQRSSDRQATSEVQPSPARLPSQASVTRPEGHSRSTLSSSTTARGIPEFRRSGHKSNLSMSSISTDSSLHTQTSTTSSSRGVPSSVKTKIAQLEARNRALRSFSTVGPPSGDESDASSVRKSWSTLAMPHYQYKGSSVEDLRRSAVPEDSVSVSSADSRYSGDLTVSRLGRIEPEAFRPPAVKKSGSQGKWVAELKKK